MKRINEIFYSIQGEGFYTGRPAIFIRFSGCNLKCPFCDTDFSAFREMLDEEILEDIKQYPAKFIVLTGGEPSLQVDKPFITLLKKNGYYVAIETNGTNPLPEGIDWVTCSPKTDYCSNGILRVNKINEIKVVFDKDRHEPSKYLSIPAEHYYLQPCDEYDEQKNIANMIGTTEYCITHPEWNISLQTQKILKVR